jgi:hypothetical protein
MFLGGIWPGAPGSPLEVKDLAEMPALCVYGRSLYQGREGGSGGERHNDSLWVLNRMCL